MYFFMMDVTMAVTVAIASREGKEGHHPKA